MKPSSRGFALGWGVLMLASWLPGCSEEAPPEFAAPPVVVTPVVARDVMDRIEASGELIARRDAYVGAEVAGRVTEIVIDEGSEVAAGDVILKIDPARRRLEVSDARARLAQAQASAVEAEREAARISALHEKGVASQARLEQVQTELLLSRSRADGARAQLGVANRALADAEVKAPFAGVIAERLVSEGEFLQPGTALFQLVSIDPVDVEFHLPEADASRVARGQSVTVKVTPWPEETFHALVRFVAPTIDSETHTLLVRAELRNDHRRLRPGLFAAVDLGIAERTGVAMIPEEAVLQRADGDVAFRVGSDLRVERLLIETGEHLESMVEVTRGLSVGDRIVVRGHYALVDGALVQPRTPDGKPAGDVAGSPPDDDTATP
jgi:RND family efflux transporter MFP subunit